MIVGERFSSRSFAPFNGIPSSFSNHAASAQPVSQIRPLANEIDLMPGYLDVSNPKGRSKLRGGAVRAPRPSVSCSPVSRAMTSRLRCVGGRRATLAQAASHPLVSMPEESEKGTMGYSHSRAVNWAAKRPMRDVSTRPLHKAPKQVG